MITLNQKELLNALKNHNKITKSKLKLACLDYLRINPINDGVSFSSTNLQDEYVSYFKCNNDIQSFTIPKKQVLDIVSKFKNGMFDEVNIVPLENDWVEIRQGEISIKVQGIPMEDYPDLTDISEFDFSFVNAIDIKDAIKATSSIKPVLGDKRAFKTCTYFKTNGEMTDVLSTDGWRLNYTQIDGDSIFDNGMLLFKNSLNFLEKLITKKIHKISIGCSNLKVAFLFSDSVFITSIVEGDFPNYVELIKMELPFVVHCGVDELIESLGTSKCVSDTVHFILDEDQLMLKSINLYQESEFNTSIPVEYDQNRFEGDFNVGYLLDALKLHKSECIQINVKDHTTPMRITGKNAITNIMPKRRD